MCSRTFTNNAAAVADDLLLEIRIQHPIGSVEPCFRTVHQARAERLQPTSNFDMHGGGMTFARKATRAREHALQRASVAAAAEQSNAGRAMRTAVIVW